MEVIYQQGNYFAQRRYALMHRLIEFIGLESERLFVEWVSASEGKKFAEVVTTFTESVRALGPNPIKRIRKQEPDSLPVAESVAQEVVV